MRYSIYTFTMRFKKRMFYACCTYCLSQHFLEGMPSEEASQPYFSLRSIRMDSNSQYPKSAFWKTINRKEIPAPEHTLASTTDNYARSIELIKELGERRRSVLQTFMPIDLSVYRYSCPTKGYWERSRTRKRLMSEFSDAIDLVVS